MIAALTISLISSGGMIALALTKTKIQIKKISLSTYWLAPLFGALILLVFQLISFKEVGDGLTASTAINPIKILILFFSMTLLSIFLDETGFFKFLANAVLKKTGTSQIKLFTAFYLTISLLTVFTSNDIIILTFTPFICYFAKNAKINPLPYLISEFVAANTASMFLIIGNPTNIYLATASGISFMDYLKVMAIPTIFAVTTAYLVMLLLFRKQLKKPLSSQVEEVEIEDKSLLILALTLLFLATFLLAISSYIKIEMWLIAFFFAACLMVTVIIITIARKKKMLMLKRTVIRLPWELIPFVISMFILVLSLEKYEFTNKMADVIGANNIIIKYGVVSTLFANLINNIPMSVLFSSVLSNLSANNINKGIYAVIIGSNIGAFLTPIGALAGLMWQKILKDNDLDFTFFQFLKYGFIIAIPTLLVALAGLMLFI